VFPKSCSTFCFSIIYLRSFSNMPHYSKAPSFSHVAISAMKTHYCDYNRAEEDSSMGYILGCSHHTECMCRYE